MRTIRIFGSIFVHLIFVASNGWAFPLPEQIHLSLGDHPNSMVIQWVTFDLGHGPPYVDFGFEKDRFISRLYADMETFVFEGITRYMYTAELKNLEYNTTYYYQVGSDHFMSSIYDFRTFPLGTDFSYRVCIFGDLGVENGVSSSYDLHTNKGLVGDEFMRGMESIAARFPYLVIAGNHEDDGRNYSNYISRFNMPNDPFYDNQVYRFFYEYGHLPVLNQYQWLENDLRKANANREKTPFLIGYYHRPLYCSNVRTGFEDMPGLEDLFMTHGMDVGFAGHEHSYERFYPIYNRQVFNQTSSPYYNAAAPTYIVTGSAVFQQTVKNATVRYEFLPNFFNVSLISVQLTALQPAMDGFRYVLRPFKYWAQRLLERPRRNTWLQSNVRENGGIYLIHLAENKVNSYAKKEEFPHRALTELLMNENEGRTVDFMTIDVEGAEFGLLRVLHRKRAELPIICQFNVEIHYTNERYGVSWDEVDRTLNEMLDEAYWVLLNVDQRDFKYRRLFFFNVGSEECIFKFLC
ncbi:Iron/zinc purple acid phosphatase-like protein [Aphelenchoides besseyi]|nr:Iron/zinc purple acid phosphatase-like protein [Aphelenchoides besseyi]